MKRNLFCVVALSLLFAASAAGQPDRRPYRIAAILPLSGQVASLGAYVRKGIELALEEMPAEERAAIEVIFGDDEFDPKKTLSVYNQLSQGEPLDAVFTIGSPPANALAPVTERNKQILVAIGGSDPGIVKDREYAFIHWVIPAALGRRLADEILHRDFQRIAFVIAEATGTLADMNAAVEALRERKAEQRVVYNETFAKGDTDFRAAIGTLKNKKVQAVVVVLFPGQLSSFMKQARQLRLEAEIAGMETLEDEAEVKASDGAMLGKWYVNASDPTPEFVTRYRRVFGEHPGWASANGYDTVRLVAQAVVKGSGSNEEVRAHLAALRNYSGACGRYSASGDNRFLLPAALKRVTKEGFVNISTSDVNPSE